MHGRILVYTIKRGVHGQMWNALVNYDLHFPPALLSI
jgi:hypothetical protein